jgi:hypothetical protein
MKNAVTCALVRTPRDQYAGALARFAHKPRNLRFNLFFSALKFIFHRAAFQVAPEPGIS